MSIHSPAKPLPPTLKLGRKPAKRDIRTLEFSTYLNAAALPSIPPTFGWSSKVTTGWSMMGNDQIGDCVFAAIGHQIQLWAAANGKIYAPTDQQIVAAYSAVTGYDPNVPGSDQGTYSLDAYNFWRNTGIAGHKIDAFLAINPLAHKRLMQGLWLFGGSSVGVNLPKSAEKQINAGQPWTLTSGPDAMPGSWGGHEIFCLDFSPAGLTCVTWGRLQKLTWQWLDHYADDATVGFSISDWVNGVTGRAPNAVNLNHLQADLNALKAA